VNNDVWITSNARELPRPGAFGAKIRRDSKWARCVRLRDAPLRPRHGRWWGVEGREAGIRPAYALYARMPRDIHLDGEEQSIASVVRSTRVYILSQRRRSVPRGVSTPVPLT